ncbi:MAG TPA: TonB family protein [Kofleriaceae bacterium]|jgi:protein TonB|nr:TonB family protein [Kofleriaceae bacterium]
MRKWLVGVSLVVHIAILFAVFVAGAWRLDRLDAGKHHVDIAYVQPPPPASGGAPKAAAQAFTPKQHIVHETVQPVPHVAPAPVEATADSSEGTGTGAGVGSNPGDGEGSGVEGGVTCTVPTCSGEPPPPVVVPPQQQMVAPTVLKGLRISGETQIQPNDALKSQLLHEGASKLVAMFKVCVDTQGSVNATTQLRSTGYAAYDQELLGAVRAWRYRPYSVGGVAVPVCGIVTFNYEMR